MLTFNNYLILEAAPRIPNDIEYWKKKGKSGKDVCLIFHDDMDGVVSAILMKNWLQSKGFTIKKYAIINYQESWEALRLDPKLINIALDYAEDADNVDVYMDHHGSFEEEVRLKQKRPAIKTSTGSAAEGIALQLGVPFPKEIKDWIDMIDSAKYDYYKVDIRDILNFNLKQITKDKNSKLRFASAFNQLLKRSDYATFIEVVNAAKGPSIFNLFRLFKIFFPKNNPNYQSGEEADFVSDAQTRLDIMQKKTRGSEDTKERWMDWRKFWKQYAEQVEGQRKDDGSPVWKLKPGSYQIIGNLMFVPSGTWANALRAKAIFVHDRDQGIIPNDPKLNFVLLQYGNTLQVADLDKKIATMDEEDLPTLKNGQKIDNLGKYMSGLVANFEKYLDYHDKRTFHGGHDGIGTISNIFGKCTVKPYDGVKFLDLFKNKIIEDLSGIKWALSMPWNDEEKKPDIPEEEINMRMLGDDEIRSEEDALQEKKERRYLSFVILNDDWDNVSADDFKIPTMKKIYTFLKKNLSSLMYGDMLDPKMIKTIIWYKGRDRDEEALLKKGNDLYSSGMFDEIINYFGYDNDELYNFQKSKEKSRKQKEVKRLMLLMGNIMKGTYISDNREKWEQAYKKWKKNR